MDTKLIAFAHMRKVGNDRVIHAYNATLLFESAGRYAIRFADAAGPASGNAAETEMAIVNAVPSQEEAADYSYITTIVVPIDQYARRVIFLDDNGTEIDPDSFQIEVNRMPPLPNV